MSCTEDTQVVEPSLAEIKADAKALREALEDVPRLVQDFVRVTGESETRVSFNAAGYATVIHRIKHGGNLQLKTLGTLLEYLENYDAAGR